MEQEIILYGEGILAILCVGLVEAIKRAGLPTQYAPLVSAGVGMVLGVGLSFAFDEVSLGIGLFAGLLAGIMGSGAYSGQKALRE